MVSHETNAESIVLFLKFASRVSNLWLHYAFQMFQMLWTRITGLSPLDRNFPI